MHVAHEQLRGLDRDRMFAVLEPVLTAHKVDAVELIWRSDAQGWVLYLTVETPGSTDPGAGVTLDLCAEISRDLSAALDVADVTTAGYRLEVGSPGVERSLYEPSEYARFAGRLAKIKVKEPISGQRVLRGTLKGRDEEGRIVFESEVGELRLQPEQIESGRLTFDWQAARGVKPSESRRGARARRSAPRDR